MRFSCLRLILVSAFCLLAGGRSYGQLKWDHPVQEFHRVPEDKEIWAHYPFHNNTAGPVTVKSLRSSCGCTTAHLDKKTYAAGESGEILIHFVFGDRKGFYRKTVTVTTDDKTAEPEVLNLLITINDPVTLTPALIFWKTGEPATAKSVQFTAAATQPVHVKSVTSSNPRLIATLETTKAGQQYAISVAPADTAQKESGEISVQTDFPADAPRVYTIHARIK